MTTRREFWFVLCCGAQLRAQDEPVFTAEARDVPVDTAVTRNQRPFRGLRAEDFVLLENGQRQPIRAVTKEELPLDMVLILPRSPGPVPRYLIGEKAKRAARMNDMMRERMLNGASNVLLKTRPEDRVAFLTHTDPPRIELPFTNDRNAMAAGLRRIAAMDWEHGFSEPLTIEYAVHMLADLGRTPDRRRLIVRLGTVGGIRYSDEPTIRRLWSENIIFSTIEIMLPGEDFNPGFSTPADGLSLTGDSYGRLEPTGPLYRIANPNHIAQATGGDAVLFLDPKDPLDMVTPMRQRYALWFRQPEGVAAGEERKISVELAPEVRERYPDAVVKARSGYVAR